jgi:hypothetical protein
LFEFAIVTTHITIVAIDRHTRFSAGVTHAFGSAWISDFPSVIVTRFNSIVVTAFCVVITHVNDAILLFVATNVARTTRFFDPRILAARALGIAIFTFDSAFRADNGFACSRRPAHHTDLIDAWGRLFCPR